MFLYSAILFGGTMICKLLLQSSNAFAPNCVISDIFLSIVTEESDEQFINAFSSIYSRLEGKTILSKLEHPLNAEAPIEIILFGNATNCKDEHPSNALSSMCFTLLDKIILFKLEHPLNAEAPMLVTFIPPIVSGILIYKIHYHLKGLKFLSYKIHYHFHQ